MAIPTHPALASAEEIFKINGILVEIRGNDMFLLNVGDDRDQKELIREAVLPIFKAYGVGCIAKKTPDGLCLSLLTFDTTKYQLEQVSQELLKAISENSSLDLNTRVSLTNQVRSMNADLAHCLQNDPLVATPMSIDPTVLERDIRGGFHEVVSWNVYPWPKLFLPYLRNLPSLSLYQKNNPLSYKICQSGTDDSSKEQIASALEALNIELRDNSEITRFFTIIGEIQDDSTTALLFFLKEDTEKKMPDRQASASAAARSSRDILPPIDIDDAEIFDPPSPGVALSLLKRFPSQISPELLDISHIFLKSPRKSPLTDYVQWDRNQTAWIYTAKGRACQDKAIIISALKGHCKFILNLRRTHDSRQKETFSSHSQPPPKKDRDPTNTDVLEPFDLI